MKIRLLPILLLLVCSLTGLTAKAQSGKALHPKLERAAKDFYDLKYASAVPKLQQFLKLDSTNINAQEMLAYSYRMLKNYPQTLYWYERLSRQKTVKPVWALHYAEALASTQQYERAEGWYRRYLLLVPADKRAALFARAKPGSFERNLGNWNIYSTNLNTASAEYAPAFFNSGLLFSSNRPTSALVKRVFLWDNTPFTNLYVVPDLKDIKKRPVTADFDTAVEVASTKKVKVNNDDTAPTSNDSRVLGIYDPTIQISGNPANVPGALAPAILGGRINSRFHEAAPAVFPDGSIIFTRNNYFKGVTRTSKDGTNNLKLFTAKGSSYNQVTEFPYNSDEYSNGHPTLNKDGNILIFASNMPGGYGGTDLYYSVRSGKGEWTRPVNMGKDINTEGNEMFPFLGADTVLYFASTGHAGLGGLDVFQVRIKEMKAVNAPQNMGSPINSPKDDFSLIKTVDGKSGFFSSNRGGNDDIYQFERAFQLIVLQGVVTDATTRIPLQGARIFMRHERGIDTLTTNNKGEYRRELPLETDYALTTQKKGYVNKLGFVTSQGITQDSVIRLNIPLNKTETRQQWVINNCDSLKRVYAVKNVYYDLDRYEIRPNARPALDELVQLMKRHPEMMVVTYSHCDSRASEQYNKVLSLRRGQSAKAYLVARGIAASRVAVEYYGKTRLVNRCYDGIPCSEADQQLNRRTEFDVILHGVNLTQQDCDDKW